MLSLQKGAHLEMMSHMFQIFRFLPLFKTWHQHVSNNARYIFQTSIFRLENAVKRVLLAKQNGANCKNVFHEQLTCVEVVFISVFIFQFVFIFEFIFVFIFVLAF